MRIDEIVQPPKYKRPKGTLHYTNYNNWLLDMKLRGLQIELIDYETKVVAVDQYNMSYGVWFKNKKKGITFDKSRPIHVVNR